MEERSYNSNDLDRAYLRGVKDGRNQMLEEMKPIDKHVCKCAKNVVLQEICSDGEPKDTLPWWSV